MHVPPSIEPQRKLLTEHASLARALSRWVASSRRPRNRFVEIESKGPPSWSDSKTENLQRFSSKMGANHQSCANGPINLIRQQPIQRLEKAKSLSGVRRKCDSCSDPTSRYRKLPRFCPGQPALSAMVQAPKWSQDTRVMRNSGVCSCLVEV